MPMISEEKLIEWANALERRGHKPVMDAGVLDIFVEEYGTHNGPGCETCGWSTCWHCNGPETIPECSENQSQ